MALFGPLPSSYKYAVCQRHLKTNWSLYATFNTTTGFQSMLHFLTNVVACEQNACYPFVPCTPAATTSFDGWYQWSRLIAYGTFWASSKFIQTCCVPTPSQSELITLRNVQHSNCLQVNVAHFSTNLWLTGTKMLAALLSHILLLPPPVLTGAISEASW